MSTSAADLKNRLQGSIPEVNVRNHLKVLGVFFHLLESVPRDQAGDDQALDEFFQRSTYRLQLWVERIIKSGDDEHLPLHDRELPPLDVALALHSLMLSPHRYFEDSELRFRQLKRMREYPLDMIVDALDANNNGYNKLKRQPSSEYWNKLTGLEFDAIDSMNNDPIRSVICPTCKVSSEVPWKGDHGFAGSQFQHQCSACQMPLTHDTLCAGKFFWALSQANDDPGVCLPNTAILFKGELDVQSRCPAIASEAQKCFENQDGRLFTLEDAALLAATERCTIMDYIAKVLSQPEVGLRPESVPIILRAFHHSHPFTQDVVDALRHQHPSIQKIYDKGWSRPNSGRPSSDDLDIAYAQYGEFLRHIVAREGRAPGWKDDIVWHTHQLMPEQYRVDLVGFIGVFVNHLPRSELAIDILSKNLPNTDFCHSGIRCFPFLKTESVLDLLAYIKT